MCLKTYYTASNATTKSTPENNSSISIKHTETHLLKESCFNKSKVQISTKTVDPFFNVLESTVQFK